MCFFLLLSVSVLKRAAKDRSFVLNLLQCSFDSALFESSPENKKVFNGTDIMIFTLLSPKRRSVKKVVF